MIEHSDIMVAIVLKHFKRRREACVSYRASTARWRLHIDPGAQRCPD
jgi:hypothetical protein